MATAEVIQARFRAIHAAICDFLVASGGVAFREDQWHYEKGSGGGVTRVWEGNGLIEKGGVNFSAIRGLALPPSAATQFNIGPETPFIATGISLVIHPTNPNVPTIHLNVRYFEAGNVWWFGGGIDLTPYYPRLPDVIAFHRALKSLCDAHQEDYQKHKETCDQYFYLRHRQETRGVGGLFFDHLNRDKAAHFEFVCALASEFPSLYRPLIDAHRDRPYDDSMVAFQRYRRSRYVEFNLLYDRGTLFGLQSGGRTESILMSMPPKTEWRYNWAPAPGSAEAELTDFYLRPQDWLTLDSIDVLPLDT
ncbi:MAG: coproporphyrinogen oxidase [Candidatus Hydrogenedentota bacterium]